MADVANTASLSDAWDYVVSMMGADPDSYQWNNGIEPSSPTKTGLGVGIELTRSQFQQSVKQMLRIYRQFVPNEKWKVLNLVVGQTVYDLTADYLENGVLDVEYDLDKLGFGLNSIFGYPIDLTYYDPLATYDLDLYHQYLAYFETARKVFSQDFYWEFQETSRQPRAGKLLISPEPTDTMALAVKIDSYTEELTNVYQGDVDIVYDAILAFCELIVGRMRSRLGGAIQGQTTNFQVDTSLMDSGQEWRREFTEKLNQRYGDTLLLPDIG